ncbi:hypothetical protein ACERIT_05225 [Halopenitus sp. H-Gu1]|uniref:hypothetical protein n=1 Tax=Halopenitus sp. H-Gu1 TaxID=3242697 RepID=UPI00359D35BD
MPQFDVDAERINLFEIDGQYLFKQYFERTDLFEEFREYYNDDAYRFEIPQDDLDVVRERLTEAYFEPVIVDDLESFCVVKEKYTEHAEILKHSVTHWERRGHLFFIMKDELAVKEAVERGADQLEETEFVLGL